MVGVLAGIVLRLIAVSAAAIANVLGRQILDPSTEPPYGMDNCDRLQAYLFQHAQ